MGGIEIRDDTSDFQVSTLAVVMSLASDLCYSTLQTASLPMNNLVYIRGQCSSLSTSQPPSTAPVSLCGPIRMWLITGNNHMSYIV